MPEWSNNIPCISPKEIVVLTTPLSEKETLDDILQMERNLLFTYLVIPIHHRKLTNKELKIIEDRFKKKLSSWKGKLMSYGAQLTLTNVVLASLPMFMMSFFQYPKGC